MQINFLLRSLSEIIITFYIGSNKKTSKTTNNEIEPESKSFKTKNQKRLNELKKEYFKVNLPYQMLRTKS